MLKTVAAGCSADDHRGSRRLCPAAPRDHAGLQLTPEQEKTWPAFEQAYRELAASRRVRRSAPRVNAPAGARSRPVIFQCLSLRVDAERESRANFYHLGYGRCSHSEVTVGATALFQAWSRPKASRGLPNRRPAHENRPQGPYASNLHSRRRPKEHCRFRSPCRCM
jgi:hypothetical protein